MHVNWNRNTIHRNELNRNSSQHRNRCVHNFESFVRKRSNYMINRASYVMFHSACGQEKRKR